MPKYIGYNADRDAVERYRWQAEDVAYVAGMTDIMRVSSKKRLVIILKCNEQ